MDKIGRLCKNFDTYTNKYIDIIATLDKINDS